MNLTPNSKTISEALQSSLTKSELVSPENNPAKYGLLSDTAVFPILKVFTGIFASFINPYNSFSALALNTS